MITGSPSIRRQQALVGLATLTAFAFVTFNLQLSPLLTAIAETFNKSESQVGQLQTLGALVATVTAVLVAPFMGRLPRRTWFRILLLLEIAAGLVIATAQSFSWLMVGRVIAGLGASVLLANCYTLASEIVTEGYRRDWAIGLIATGTTLALMLGLPFVAQVEQFAGWRWASAATLLPLLLVLAGTHWLPSTRSARDGPVTGQRETYRAVLSDRPALTLLIATVIMFAAYIGWLTYFSAYVERDFGRGANTLTALFFVAGLTEVITNLGIPWLTQRFSGWTICIAGAVIGGLALLGFGVVFTTFPLLFVAIVLFHISTAYLYIGSNTLLVASPVEWRGAAMALEAACAGFGGAMGALLGGLVLSRTDSYERTYQVLGVLLLISVLILVIGKRSANEAAPLTQLGHNAAA